MGHLNNILTNVTGPNVLNRNARIVTGKKKKKKQCLQLSNYGQCWIDQKSKV